MTSEQLDAYVNVFRINEITNQLQLATLPSLQRARSTSPDPEYDREGRRTNTRESRHRRRLERERDQLTETAMKATPTYRPPFSYRRQSTRISDKLYIPTREFPSVNFIGQILGPRGGSLKEMNKQSGANIVLRGKGSVKGGKGRSHDETEPLHCLITADDQHKVDAAKRLLQDVIDMATTTPEYENERKRQQLRGLAVINGTFRDDEAQPRPSRLIEFQTCAEPTNDKQSRAQGVGSMTYEMDREYQQLMLEVGSNQDVETVKAPSVPPWRVDRPSRRGC